MPSQVQSASRAFGRVLGLLTLLVWLALPWIWWQTQQPAPRSTPLRGVARESIIQALSPDGRVFFCVDRADTLSRIRAYDVVQGRRVTEDINSSVLISAINRSLDGLDCCRLFEEQARRMQAGFSLVELLPPEARALLDNSWHPFRPIASSPDGRLLATLSGKLRIWDVQDNKERSRFEPEELLASLQFSPDGKQLFLLYPWCTMEVFDLTSQQSKIKSVLGRAPYIPRRYAGSVHGLVEAATVAPDGRILGVAETERDEQLSLWDVTNDREVLRCPRGESTFSADGSLWLVRRTRVNPYADWVTLWLGPVRTEWLLPKIRETLLYDTSTGLEVARIPRCGPAAVWDDGKTLAIFSVQDDALTLWDIPPRMAIHPALAWLASALAVLLAGACWRLRRKSATMKS